MEIISGEFLQRRGLVVTAMGEGRAKRPNQRTTPQTGWKTTDRFLLQRHRSAVGKQLNRYALSLDFDQTMRALNGPNLHWCWKVKFRPLRSVPAFTINWDLQNNVKREKHFEENIAAESAASWQQHINHPEDQKFLSSSTSSSSRYWNPLLRAQLHRLLLHMNLHLIPFKHYTFHMYETFIWMAKWSWCCFFSNKLTHIREPI